MKRCIVCGVMIYDGRRYSVCDECQNEWRMEHIYETDGMEYQISFGRPRFRADDESLIPTAAASLGLGMKYLPSNKYG